MMCNRYPNCDHAGPLIEKRDGLDRHCETVKPNHDCPYLMLGCAGCTFAGRKPISVSGFIRPLASPIHRPDEVAKLRRTTIALEVSFTYVNEPLLIAVVTGHWETYKMLQRLASSGLVSQKWADQSFLNVVQYAYRQVVCRLVAAYLLTRSNPND